jgi:hypothetical protein
MEMKKWHFDHTKSYIEALDATYVRIEELEAKKNNIEGDEGKEKNWGEEKTKEKGKEVVDIFNENEVLPIIVLLKEETIEIAIQNNVWKYQDKATRMDTKWIEIRN